MVDLSQGVCGCVRVCVYVWYLGRQPPHGFLLTSPHLRGPGTAATSEGAVRGLGLGEREPLSIWKRHNTLVDSLATYSIPAHVTVLRAVALKPKSKLRNSRLHSAWMPTFR